MQSALRTRDEMSFPHWRYVARELRLRAHALHSIQQKLEQKLF